MTNTPVRSKSRGPSIKEVLSTETYSFNREAQYPAAPVKSFAEQNPEYISVSLPSDFQPYPFKSLSAKTLQGLHIAKFNRAHTEKRIRFTVEAISATLEPGVSAFDLTPGDFYFLMYWQKVNSFSKTPMLIENYCLEEKHNVAVAKGEMPRESLRTEEILKMTTLETEYAKPFDLETWKLGLEKYQLGYETMRDVVDIAEFIMDSEEDQTEFAWLASYASFLKPVEGLETIQARCEVVAKMDPQEIALLDRYMESVTNYGVEEFATIKCRGCGASSKRKLSFDALSFLPGV